MNIHERAAWWIVTAHFTALFFVLGSGYDAQSVFVPELVKQFGWSRAQIGVLFTGVGCGLMVGGLLAGWLLDRINAQTVVTVGALFAATGLIAASQANRFFSMFSAFSVLGLGMGASGYVPAAFVVSNWFATERGLAVGIAMSGETAGATIMTVIAGVVIEHSSWRFSYVCLTVPIFLIVLPIVLAVVRTRPSRLQEEHDEDASEAVPLSSVYGMEVREAVKCRSFWLIAFAEFGGGFFVTAVWVHLVAYLIDIGYTAQSAAFAAGASMALATAGQPLMGIVGDRITARTALVLTFLVNAVSFLIVLEATHLVMLVSFILLFGGMLTAPVTLLAMVIADSLGMKRYGSLAGLMTFCWMAGVSLGPLAAGWIFDRAGTYSASFVTCAIVSGLSGFAILLTVPLPRVGAENALYKAEEMAGDFG